MERVRLKLGLSKQDLGEIAHVARATVSRLINDAEVPRRPATLDRIGVALG
ncbi:helix-turn-helix domain-containing protein [Mycobacterium kansasii]